MMYVDVERCDGCGLCLDSCPPRAIGLDAGRALIDESLCTGCHACLPVCPAGAIIAAELVESDALTPYRAPGEVSLVRSLGGLARPALTAALCWTGRQLLPLVAELAADGISNIDLRRSRATQLPARRAGAGRSGRMRRQRQRRDRRQGQ